MGWQDAEDVLRRHIVTGGLTIEERRRLFLSIVIGYLPGDYIVAE